ncbi:MAG: glycoside hydrolase family 95 protein, partial [Bacteroidales bacterium]|nr:glycoside hydrolase family 95 protein [Bacteroidales bacterium]
INFYARLWDGEEAYKHLQLLFRKSTKANLFDNHPPFQIDGNFGGAAGMAEMLVQSRQGKLYIFPALPDAWKNGSINGLKARGDIEINLEWKNGKIIKGSLLSPTDQKLSVTYHGHVSEIQLIANKRYKLNL